MKLGPHSTRQNAVKGVSYPRKRVSIKNEL
jgi:hypothetical protein